MIRAVGVFRPEYLVGSSQRSGELLAEVCLGAITPPAGQLYISQVKGQATFPAPSALARCRDVQDTLWRESATMVGLPQK